MFKIKSLFWIPEMLLEKFYSNLEQLLAEYVIHR